MSSFKKEAFNINERIRAHTVRVIDSEGEMLGVMSTKEAINTARDLGLDLIEMSPNAKPPVCKIVDYGKFKYEQSKKQSIAKKAQKQVELKEIKFRPTTEINDYNTKLKHIREFIEKGNKVKATIRFRGREMAHNELGMDLLRRVIEDVKDIAKVDSYPKIEGRQMGMMLSPDNNK